MGTSRQERTLKEPRPRRLAIGGRLTLALALALIGFWRLLPTPLFQTPVADILVARNGELLEARIAADGQWRFPPLAVRRDPCLQ